MRARVLWRHRASCIALLGLAAATLGCSHEDVTGYVVKGPVAGASLEVRRIDPGMADLRGALVSSGTTRSDGGMQNASFPAGLVERLLLESNGGLDTSTFQPPVVFTLRSVLDPRAASPERLVFATPLTTLTLELAIQTADLSVGLYPGNDDGVVSHEELVEALPIAEGMVRATFGLGVLDGIDLFASPPIVLASTSDPDAQTAVLAHRTAIEVFSALLVQLRDHRATEGFEVSTNELIVWLARDLADGQIDAAEFGVALPALPDADALARLLQQPPGELPIPNSPLRVDQLNQQLAAEAIRTAPFTFVRWWTLSLGPLDPVALVVDVDGDGVPDPQDVFPEDASEWADADGDGVGDNADAIPSDAACWALRDTEGPTCIVRLLAQGGTDQIVLGADGTLYLLRSSEERVLRWDVATRHFLPPIGLRSGPIATRIAHHEAHGRLYVGYDDGAVSFVEPGVSPVERGFTSLANSTIFALVAVDDLVFVNLRTFDANGLELGISSSGHYSATWVWDGVMDRMYAFRDSLSPNDLVYYEIDPMSGVFSGKVDSPYHGAYEITAPIVVSEDGSRVLLGSGDVYDADGLLIADAIPGGLAHADWPLGSGPVTVRGVDGRTRIERRDVDLSVEEYLYLEGEPRGLFPVDGTYLIPVSDGTSWRFEIYVPSDDTDGDGVENGADRFPLDPSASIDTDDDGYPDAWNPGTGPEDSTEGLVLDAFPDDSACQLPEHARPAEPDVCDITASIPVYTPARVVADADGVVHLLSPEHGRIFRWAEDTGDLNPLIVGDDPQQLAYSAENGRLYLGYATGEITQLDPGESHPRETHFTSTPGPTTGLQTAGRYVWSIDPSGAWASHYTFEPDGTLISNVAWNYMSSETTWSQAAGRMYFFRDGVSPNDLHWEAIDPDTGAITGGGDSPYHGAHFVHPPIRVSRDGSKLVLGTGKLYDAITLSIIGDLGFGPLDALWLEDGSLTTILETGEGGTRVEQWSDDLRLYGARVFEGDPIRIVQVVDAVFVITRVDGRLAFSEYVPIDDGDGDGVPNDEDAFQLDPAASIDSDGDGYPDAWNPGMGPGDSTDGLVLDAFPLDPICQLPEHADPLDPSRCDIARSIPSYTPTQIVADGDGVVHLLSADNDTVFRWSVDDAYHIAPLPVGAGAIWLEYSGANDRLYLGYDDGVITQIDPKAASPSETSFASVAGRIFSLQSAGPFLVAPWGASSYATYTSFGSDGTPLSAFVAPASVSLAFSAANDRLYYLQSFSSNRYLNAEDIDPITGAFTGSTPYPYVGWPRTDSPVRVSPDGARVLLGSGNLYDGDSLELVDALPITPTDAVWLPDGSLVTIRPSGDGRTWLEHLDASLAPYNVGVFDGEPIRVLLAKGRAVVVTNVSGRPAFHVYGPTDDADGDGIPNAQDAFVLDPAASLDTDRDGVPDAWNAGMGPADSTDGLVLDAFPLDSACQLAQHARTDRPDLCDVAGTIPAYLPAEIVADELGMIHLLSPENDRVYRWSSVTGVHANPIVTASAPRHLAYSDTHRRLHLSYDSGAITQVEIADPWPVERPFSALPVTGGPLLSAGGALVAFDFANPFTIAPDGSWVDTISSDKPRAIVWSQANHRMYSVTANDLVWHEIDPATSAFGSEGEAPYHHVFELDPPVRVSVDGSRVLLGSGDLYDGHTLVQTESLPLQPTDALWLDDGTLVTIRPNGDGRTRLEHWNADLTLYSLGLFAGDPLRVLWAGSTVAVVTHANGRPAFSTYVPTDDADGDGTVNPIDAFPLDPAAALDTDHDGHPDAWNPGMGPQDSVTGLTLDAFPLDAACHQPEHALPGQPTVCDISGQIPGYVPDRIVADASGVVYLLSGANDRIFRWSTAADQHLDPLVTGSGPTQMAHSEVDGRLYLGYPSGSMTQMDVMQVHPAETGFATTPEEIVGLQTAGSFVFGVDLSGSIRNYTFGSDGSKISDQDRKRRALEYTWSPANDRMYSHAYGNRLVWQAIDPITGALAGYGEVPDSNVTIAPPIRVSADGAQVLVGSGHVFDAQTLDVVRSIRGPLVDALWLDTGELIVLHDRQDGTTVLDHWTADASVYDQQAFEGAPLRVVLAGAEITVVTSVGGRPSFHNYVPTADGDGDGVDFMDDDFPLDPAASLDSDFDGAPDDWNPGMGPGDSTEGLVLDAYPYDSACQLATHGVNGACDYPDLLPPTAAEPFCDTDAPIASGTNGVLALGRTADYVPLCDGWLLIADADRHRIEARNVLVDRTGARFDLPGIPGDLELDEARKLLYAALPDRRAVAEIDLLTADVQVFFFPASPTSLALMQNGDLLVLGVDGNYEYLSWLPGDADSPLGPWGMPDELIRWNDATNELITTDRYYWVRRYALDPGAGPRMLQQAVGRGGRDLTVSPDGRHVALAGYERDLVDYDGSDLDRILGTWRVGNGSSGVGFDRLGHTLVVSSGYEIVLFDVASHAELDRHVTVGCTRSILERVEFSRGGAIVFGRTRCGYTGDSSQVDWFVP